MSYYKVLSKPISTTASPNYKGLYRSEPFPNVGANNQFIALWERYVQYLVDERGITIELTINELKDFANLASQATDDCYEVIFFDENSNCPLKSNYYGIDVTGRGGYSMLGENLFRNPANNDNKLYYLFEVINQYFNKKLNEYGLFGNIEDATLFQGVLKECNHFFPNHIEEEEWHTVHVFKII